MHLQAVNGLLVCVELAGADNVGVVNARTLPESAGPWEMLTRHELGNGKVALSITDESTGITRYFSAQPDGTIQCNRVTPDCPSGEVPDQFKLAVSAWEEAEEIKTEGGYAFKFWTGYLCADLGLPGARLVANRTEIGSWETFTRIATEGEETLPPADRKSFRSSFCSHRDDHGEPMFDPVYFGVMWKRGDLPSIDAMLETKRELGLTACILCVQGSYGNYLGGESFDFRSDPEVYGDLCRYVRDRGFTPIILVGTADGGTWKEIYDGTMARVLDAVADLAPDAWYCAGYEQDLDRGGGYSARQMDDALRLMRDRLGPEALLLLWLQPNRCTPASYWGSDKNHKPTPPDWNPVELKWITSESDPNEGAWIEADDPYGGDEQGAYYMSAGKEIDGLFYQTDHGSNGPSYPEGGSVGVDGHGQPRWIDRVIECADRFLAPGTPMPGAQGHIDGSGITHTSDVCPSASAPDWFASERARGRVLFIIGETVAYEYLRGQCCDEAVRECCEVSASLGLGAPLGSFQAY